MKPERIAIIALTVVLATPLAAGAAATKLAGKVQTSQAVVAANAGKTRSVTAAAVRATSAKNDATPVKAEAARQLIAVAGRWQSLLREQLDSEKERHQKFGQESADDAMRLATEETDKIKNEAEEEIEAARLSARGYAQQEIIAAITEDSRRRQLAVRCNRQAEANQHLGLAQTRAQALEQTAKNLSDEMAKMRNSGRFGLSPIGSNLYVRNYNHTATASR